ncbi:tissue inhibitor of metalloproteinase [Cydia strobilella]|uniref:tissue inhibitor of metalloproteinase n=1 Tax=Cydia strobilella TaxID=1100964 RepID=UPI0030077859
MLTRWVFLALAVSSWRSADGCTCMLEHPQTHFCNSDFVIVGRVQKMFKGNSFYDTYKMKIRNVFKATQKAQVALKSGRILTPTQDGLCGVTLKPRETYVITGHVTHLQAHVNLCEYVNKWREVTPRQRKGFRQLYKQGCTCKVKTNGRGWRSGSPNTCFMRNDECYERHGICLHNRQQQCHWTRAPALTRCLQKQHFNGTMT